MAKPDPVVVIGAGPVGLCLALALAQQEVAVVLVEEIVVRHRLDQEDGNILLRQRQRQAKPDRASAHDDDRIGLRH